jgi:hypothetical protein
MSLAIGQEECKEDLIRKRSESLLSISVRKDMTPNPNAIKLTANTKLFDGRYIAKKGDTVDNPLAEQLLAINGVDNIFGYEDFVTVNKTFDASWDELLPRIEAVFETMSL